jgi:hypothetical protein
MRWAALDSSSRSSGGSGVSRSAAVRWEKAVPHSCFRRDFRPVSRACSLALESLVNRGDTHRSCSYSQDPHTLNIEDVAQSLTPSSSGRFAPSGSLGRDPERGEQTGWGSPPRRVRDMISDATSTRGGCDRAFPRASSEAGLESGPQHCRCPATSSPPLAYKISSEGWCRNT